MTNKHKKIQQGEVRDEKGRFAKGTTSWMTGKHIPMSEERKRKISIGITGENNPMKKIETRQKLSIINKGKHTSPRTEFKIGHKPLLGMTGKVHTKESNEKNRLKHLGKHNSPNTEFKEGQMSLEKHHNWLGGKSFEPYGLEFNKQLREQIRKRDGFRCQQCFHHQNEIKNKLSVHHIDFNKKNNSPTNLISLCKSCHTQTNYGRENWTNYYNNMISLMGEKINIC